MKMDNEKSYRMTGSGRIIKENEKTEGQDERGDRSMQNVLSARGPRWHSNESRDRDQTGIGNREENTNNDAV